MSDDTKDLKEGEEGEASATLSDNVLDAFDEDSAVDEEGEEEADEDEEQAWAEEMGLNSDSF